MKFDKPTLNALAILANNYNKSRWGRASILGNALNIPLDLSKYDQIFRDELFYKDITITVKPSLWDAYARISIVEFTLNEENKESINAFFKRIDDSHIVEECCQIAGDNRFLAKIITHPFSDKEKELEKLFEFSDIDNIVVREVKRTVKKTYKLPVPDANGMTQDVDAMIKKYLKANK